MHLGILPDKASVVVGSDWFYRRGVMTPSALFEKILASRRPRYERSWSKEVALLGHQEGLALPS